MMSYGGSHRPDVVNARSIVKHKTIYMEGNGTGLVEKDSEKNC